MSQIHQDLSNKSLEANANLSNSLGSTMESAMNGDRASQVRSNGQGKQIVFSFFGEWTRAKSDISSSHILHSKPKALWHAENALINVASSLTVARITKLDNGSKSAKQEDSLDQILEEARAEAKEDIRPYLLEKEKQNLKELLIKIESNQLKFESEKERFETLEDTKESLRNIALDMRKARPQYTRALKSLRNCAKTIVKTLEQIEDIDARKLIAESSVTFLHEMMEPVETSWKGITGKSEDLNREMPEGMSFVERLIQIRDHLSLKIDAIDAKQFRRLEKIANHPIFSEIIERHAKGDLPEDGSIFFFIDSMRPMLRVDACQNPKPRPGQSKESAIRHAVKTPEFLDIKRLDKGIGPDGAGLFRFAELTDRIIGAVVLTPVTQDGKIVRLPGMKKPKRQVNELIGTVPDCIEPTMSYGAVLNKFRPNIEKLLAEKLMH